MCKSVDLIAIACAACVAVDVSGQVCAIKGSFEHRVRKNALAKIAPPDNLNTQAAGCKVLVVPLCSSLVAARARLCVDQAV